MVFVSVLYFLKMLREVYDLDEARHSPHVAQKRQRRIRKILTAAFAIAREEGREALTLKRLAERQGLTTAALYRYFPSKDALVAELRRVAILSLAQTTDRCVAAARDFATRKALDDIDRALLDIVVSAFVFEAFSRRAPVEFEILAVDLRLPEPTYPNHEATHVFGAAWSTLSNLTTNVAAAQSCSALDEGEASERAIALGAGLQGVVQTQQLAGRASGRVDSTAIARGLVCALLIGWGAPSERVHRVVEWTRDERFVDLPDMTTEWFAGFPSASRTADPSRIPKRPDPSLRKGDAP